MTNLISTVEEFQTEVINHQGRVLVDIFASWCGPCQALKPIVERLADTERDTLKVVTIDGDQSPELVQALQVQAYPTLYVFIDGEARNRTMGALPYEQLRAFALNT